MNSKTVGVVMRGQNITMLVAILKSQLTYPEFHWLLGCHINERTSLNLG